MKSVVIQKVTNGYLVTGTTENNDTYCSDVLKYRLLYVYNNITDLQEQLPELFKDEITVVPTALVKDPNNL